MAITAAGFDGAVDEAAFSRMMAEGGSPYGPFCSVVTGDPDRFAGQVVVKPGGTREVLIAPFASTAWGVRVTSTAQEVKQSPVVGSGTRYDLICVRRDWSGTGGTATIEVVTGTSVQQIPTSANKVNAAGAGVDDQPLALVQYVAGQTNAAAIIDLRTWPSKVHYANSLLAVPKVYGARAIVNGELWRVDAALSWVSESPRITHAGTVTHTYRGGTQPPATFISFPQWFGGMPSVQLGCNDPGIDLWYSVKGTQGFYVNSRSNTGPRAVLNLDISWTASGPRA